MSEDDTIPPLEDWLRLHKINFDRALPEFGGLEITPLDRERFGAMAPCAPCFKIGVAIAVPRGEPCPECGVVARVTF